MRRAQSNSFGVRFYRRGVRSSAMPAESNQNSAAPALPQCRAHLGDDVAPVTRGPIHMMHELTAPQVPHPAKPDRLVSAPAAARTLELALWAAAQKGDCAAIRRLVLDGADLDARDAQGRTAIHIASQNGHADALKTLLAGKELRALAARGDLPATDFFQRFANTADNF